MHSPRTHIPPCLHRLFLCLLLVFSFASIQAQPLDQIPQKTPSQTQTLPQNQNALQSQHISQNSPYLDLIIEDIYRSLCEMGEVAYDELLSDLYELAASPIDLHRASAADLERLRFLSDQQIDDILLYTYSQPMRTLAELRLIPSLTEYDIRNLLPFVQLSALASDTLSFPSLFRYAHHEVLTRLDARHIEQNTPILTASNQTNNTNNTNSTNSNTTNISTTTSDNPSLQDPFFVQTRYRLHSSNRLFFGATLQRAPSASAQDMTYGVYIQLNDIYSTPLHQTNIQQTTNQSPHPKHHQPTDTSPTTLQTPHHPTNTNTTTNEHTNTPTHPNTSTSYPSPPTFRLKTLVLGNYQASFGLGLVLASPYSSVRSRYVLTAGNASEGLRRYTSTDGRSLHGLGTTLQFDHPKYRIDLSALYSLAPANDSILRHVLATHLSLRRGAWKVGLTLAHNIYSDSLTLYRNLAYNTHYFRGTSQTLLGANFRYHAGRVDIFGELSTAQNRRWGLAAQLGGRAHLSQGLGLLLLARYYSPWFDNTLAHSYSQTTRLNDEYGLYIGLDISRFRHWHILLFGDIFAFQGIKYAIPYAPSLGYETMAEATFSPSSAHSTTLRLHSKAKGDDALHTLRLSYRYLASRLSLLTQFQANLSTPFSQPSQTEPNPISSQTTTTQSASQSVPSSTSTEDINPQTFSTQTTTASTSTNPSSTFGLSLLQDLDYRFASIPLALNARVQIFYAPTYANRIYTYERDVLYASSIPMVYGEGLRLFFNLRYLPTDYLSLYLRPSLTVYSSHTMTTRQIPRTRTDLHFLLRFHL